MAHASIAKHDPRKERCKKMSAQRIDPEETRRRVNSGDALLVCAYDELEKCQKYRLSNALSLNRLHDQEEQLAKDRKIIFYCA